MDSASKFLILILAVFSITLNGFADNSCRGSEGTCAVAACVRCEELGGDKFQGAVSILSRSSNPVIVDPESDLKKCIPCACGDRFRDEEEECDDGNNKSRDGCSVICQIERCGDEIINLSGEECDDANLVDTDNCTNTCKHPICGDSIKWDNFEECDDGNTIDTDNCTNTCKHPICGDNIKWENSEECDDGNTIDTDLCTNTCKNARCGDGIKTPLEECDDGNSINTDSCSNTCNNPKCGDGIPHFNEECDDANTVNNDTCNNSCRIAYCGDKIVGPNEECDDGNNIDTDSCTNDCHGECQFYQIHNYVGYENWDMNNIIIDPTTGEWRNNTKVFTGKDGLDLSQISCLSQFWGNYGNVYQTYNGSGDDTLFIALELWMNGYDDLARILVSDPNKNYGSYMDIYSFFISDGIDVRLKNGFWGGVNSVTDVFFDKDCKPYFDLPTDRGGICGQINAGMWHSPISLELEGSVDDNWKLVEFALEPGKPGWVVWKASDKTPLLVYDPEHTGIVSDGSSLFGNWTNLHQIQNVSLGFNKHIPKWRDGYEALAKLDFNLDGEVSGTELEPLALWYDKNRNAISEPGEIVKLSKTEVISLDYTADFRGEKDIYNSDGFKKLVDGAIITGSSVDWYSEMHTSQSSLINSLSNKIDLYPVVESPGEASFRDMTDFTGAWLWKANEKVDQYLASGTLYLKDDGSKVRGFSLVEMPLDKNSKSYRSTISRYAVEGEKVQRDGKTYLEFKVLDKKGVATKSVTYIDDNGQLVGETKAKLRQKNKQITELTYNWIGVKNKK